MENKKTAKSSNMIDNLGKASFWMMLMGILSIIGGAVQVISIIGILWAWIPIWMGVLLFQAGMAAKEAKESNDNAQAELAVKKITTCFKIAGIVAIVSISIVISTLIIALAVGFNFSNYLQ